MYIILIDSVLFVCILSYLTEKYMCIACYSTDCIYWYQTAVCDISIALSLYLLSECMQIVRHKEISYLIALPGVELS